MSKSIKLKNNMFIDSKGIDYKHTNLETTLDNMNTEINNMNTKIDTKEDKMVLVYSGALKGGSSTTLDTTKIQGKKFLKVCARVFAHQSIVYDVNLEGTTDHIYGGGAALEHDTSNGLYISECKYTYSSGLFQHTRTGYISGTSYTARNNNVQYVIDRIYAY